MMLQDIFDQLAYGELSQLYVAGDGTTEGMREADKPRMIAHIQLGLTALHKRFRLKEGHFTLELVPGRSSYVLKSAFAQSNLESAEPVKFINDVERPFKDDLLRVERVVDDKGNEWTLNKAGDPLALRTPSFNTLIVPDFTELPEEARPVTLTVFYRADHPKINPIIGQYVSFTEEVDLPVTHLEPLLYFVASRVMNPVGLSGEFHEGNNYAAKYEQACMALEMHGFQQDNEGDQHRFDNYGWR